MPISQDKTEKISYEVIKVLIRRFDGFPENDTINRNAPFHEAFLKAFQNKLAGHVTDIPYFVSLSSWLHGLNTTLGLSFFENVANILCDGEKREYTSKKLGNLKIKKLQKIKVNEIITRLSNKHETPNLSSETAALKIQDHDDLENAINFTADVFMMDERGVTAIELKSVRPNSGEMRGEKQKILEGKAAFMNAFPNQEVFFFIGFPFDPTEPSNNPTGSDKSRFLKFNIEMEKFFAHEEIKIASELWDFLSGEYQTMEALLTIINSIATHDFKINYDFLQDTHNREDNRDQYQSILSNWRLFSELRILENDNEIQQKVQKNINLQRIYNQSIFKDGEYNTTRASAILDILNQK